MPPYYDRVPAEGPPSRRHFVEHEAEREQVGPAVERFARGLFGRHVEGGPDGDTGRRDRPGLGRRVCLRFEQLSILARPKSSTFARPSRVMNMFAGLMSRWTMPFASAAWSASAI